MFFTSLGQTSFYCSTATLLCCEAAGASFSELGSVSLQVLQEGRHWLPYSLDPSGTGDKLQQLSQDPFLFEAECMCRKE